MTVGPKGRVRERIESPWRLFGPLHGGAPDQHRYSIGNATAGLFAGDELTCEVRLLAGSHVEITSPSATYVFTMPFGDARIDTRIVIEPGARLSYVPGALIPYSGSRFEQATHIEVDPSASLFALDIVMLGRLAYGEKAQFDRLASRTHISVGGVLQLADNLILEPGRFGRATLLGGWGGYPCLGTLTLAGAESERVDLARRATRDAPARAARRQCCVHCPESGDSMDSPGPADVVWGATRVSPSVVVLRALGPHPEAVRQVLTEAYRWLYIPITRDTHKAIGLRAAT